MSQEHKNSRRVLQSVTALLTVVPLLTGVLSLFGLSDPLYRSVNLPPSTVLDSNLRFFGGLWLGLGLALLWLVPQIEKQTVLFRVIWGAVFLGGVGRLLSIIFGGMPPPQFIGFTVLELVGAPLFIYWQSRVARVKPWT